MKPKLSILPSAQLKLWPRLASTQKQWVLYGGTAVALHLGHRESVDFDFFSSEPLNRDALIQALPFLSTAVMVQPEPNTLNAFLKTDDGPVKFQFLGEIQERQGRVDLLEKCEDNDLSIPSLLDLFATKLNTVQADLPRRRHPTHNP